MDGGPVACRNCNATMKNFAEFSRHMHTHLLCSDLKLKCVLCDASFTDQIVMLVLMRLFFGKSYW
ncbi:unnamed protein product [Gongylonema pulchrum]|uniref:C2H2-type domain-containing protein n=1 Tax=Gongylonema pulchrum TaxID=637853 RepID=A0A183EMW3_9BILA|nr:unnamed protein product [Gongylonema pulchrum]